MSHDAHLLRRYSEEGSQEAFAELVERHLRLVYGTALRQLGGDSHLAEDATQRVFADLARKARALSDHPSLVGWLFVSARYAAAKLVRQEIRRREREERMSAEFSDRLDPRNDGDLERIRPALDGLVGRLGESERMALLLRFFEDKTFTEIGAVLGLSEDGARSRVNRAIDRLRGTLARRGIHSTAAALAAVLSEQSLIAAPAHLAAKVTSSALASAASISGPQAFLLQMTTTAKAATVAAVALLIAALGTAIYEYRDSQQSQGELAAAQTSYSSLASQLHDLQQRGRPGAQAPSPNPSATASAAGSGTAGWDPVAEGKAFLGRHPELMQPLAAEVDDRTKYRYRALFKQLGLTPAQIEQFLALNREGNGVQGTLNGNTVALNTGTGMSDAQKAAGFEALLGTDGYAQLLQFNKGPPGGPTGGGVAGQLASNLAFTDVPLSPAQADQLSKIAAQNYSDENMAYDWKAIMAGAANVLSPAQLSALSSVRTEDENLSPLAASTRAAQRGPSPQLP